MTTHRLEETYFHYCAYCKGVGISPLTLARWFVLTDDLGRPPAKRIPIVGRVRNEARRSPERDTNVAEAKLPRSPCARRCAGIFLCGRPCANASVLPKGKGGERGIRLSRLLFFEYWMPKASNLAQFQEISVAPETSLGSRFPWKSRFALFSVRAYWR